LHLFGGHLTTSYQFCYLAHNFHNNTDKKLNLTGSTKFEVIISYQCLKHQAVQLKQQLRLEISEKKNQNLPCSSKVNYLCLSVVQLLNVKALLWIIWILLCNINCAVRSLAFKIPCGTEVLLVLIFAIFGVFSAIRKNKFPQNKITANFFPQKFTPL